MSEKIELLAEAIGGLYAVATLIAIAAPREWRMTQWCSKHAGDIREIQQWLGARRVS